MSSNYVNAEKVADIFECSLCNYLMEGKERTPTTIIKCSHVFCKSCLNNKELTHNQCPTCRRSYDPDTDLQTQYFVRGAVDQLKLLPKKLPTAVVPNEKNPPEEGDVAKVDALLTLFKSGEESELRDWWYVYEASKPVILEVVHKYPKALLYLGPTIRIKEEVLLAALNNDMYSSEILELLPMWLRHDYEAMYIAIRRNGSALRHASDELKSNYSLVLEAVKSNHFALDYPIKYACESLRDNEKIAKESVERGPYSLLYVSDRLKDSSEIVGLAMKKSPALFEYASNRLKNNRKFVLDAVEKDGMILEYVDKSLKGDREIVTTAVKNNCFAIQFTSDKLQRDKELLLTIIKNHGLTYLCTSKQLTTQREYLLSEHEGWLSDKELMVKSLEADYSPYGIKYVDKSLRKDKNFVMQILAKHPLALKYVHPDLTKDRDVVKAAVQRAGRAIEYANTSLKIDEEIAKAAVANDGDVLKYLDNKFRQNYSIVFTAVSQNGRALKHVDKSLQDNLVIAKEAIKQEPKALEYVSEGLKKNKDVVYEAVFRNPDAFVYADAGLKNQKDFILQLLKEKKYVDGILGNVDESLRNDIKFMNDVLDVVITNGSSVEAVVRSASAEIRANRSFILRAVQKSGHALAAADPKLAADKRIVSKALDTTAFALDYVADKELKNDKDLALKAVRKNGEAMRSFGFSMRNDKEVVKEAVKNSPMSLAHASFARKDDEEVVQLAVKGDPAAIHLASARLFLSHIRKGKTSTSSSSTSEDRIKL